MQCALSLILGSPGGTGCNGVRFLVHGDWDNRDVSVAGTYDSVERVCGRG